MVPFGLTTEQFVARYRRSLDRASPQAISRLRELFQMFVPETVHEAEVQIFFGDDGLSNPTAYIYFSGENTKVDHKDPTIFPGRAMELDVGLRTMDSFDERYFTNEDFPGLYMAANTVKAWFAECWWKAGGWSYKLPTAVRVHDDFGDGTGIKLSETTR